MSDTVTLRRFACAKCNKECGAYPVRARRSWGFVLENRSGCHQAPVRTLSAHEVQL